MQASNLKSDLTYVNTQLDNIIHFLFNYDTTDVSTINLNLTSNITYVDSLCQVINNKFQLYETIVGTDITLSDVNTQLDNINRTFLNYDILDVSTIKFNLKIKYYICRFIMSGNKYQISSL